MGFLSNLSTKWKLISGFLSVAAITAVVGGIGFWGAYRLAANVEEIGAVRLPSVQSLLIISEAQTAIDSAENALLNKGIDAAARKQQYDRIKDAWQRVETNWAIYEPLPQTAEEAAIWNEFVPAWNAWKADRRIKWSKYARGEAEPCLDFRRVQPDRDLHRRRSTTPDNRARSRQ